MKLSVVLPAYNEKGNLNELVNRLIGVFSKEKIKYELICVIQGKDGTKEEIEELQNKNIKIRYYNVPIGVGPAHRIGYRIISADTTHVLTMDADLNHQPEEIPRFVEAIKNADIVIGSRYIQGGIFERMPLWKLKLSEITNFVLKLVFNLKVKDKTSGYRLVKKEVIDTVLPYLRYRNFEYYPEFLVRSAQFGYRMAEVPITFKFRIRGKSKMNLFRSFFGYAKLGMSRVI